MSSEVCRLKSLSTVIGRAYHFSNMLVCCSVREAPHIPFVFLASERNQPSPLLVGLGYPAKDRFARIVTSKAGQGVRSVPDSQGESLGSLSEAPPCMPRGSAQGVDGSRPSVP